MSCLCPRHADVTKHAVLGKFNEIRPGMYREFMKVRCRLPTSLPVLQVLSPFSPQHCFQSPDMAILTTGTTAAPPMMCLL